MAWTAPKTWAPNDLVTASELNLQWRDNLLHIRNAPWGFASLSNVSTTSPSWQVLAQCSVDITSNPAGVLMVATLAWSYLPTYGSYYRFLIDTTQLGPVLPNSDRANTWCIPHRGFTPGVHQFYLEWFSDPLNGSNPATISSGLFYVSQY